MSDRCTLALIAIYSVGEHTPQGALADHHQESPENERDPLTAELLRLNIMIEKLRHLYGVDNPPGIDPLIVRTWEIMCGRNLLDFAVPIAVPNGGLHPFEKSPNYFHRIKIGKNGVKVTDRRQSHLQRTVTLKKTFEISDLITQGQWALVFGRNPSDLCKQGVFRVGEEDQVDAFRPVERITFWSVLVFANKVSEMEGRKPVYDLTQMKFNGEAADGTLKRVDGELRIDMKANGYRLPTEPEWEYVARGGRSNPNFEAAYSFGDDTGQLSAHAWFRDNSFGSTQWVRMKKKNPLGVYDMHGNLWEWVQDEYGEIPPEEFDSVLYSNSGSNRVLRGGSWYDYVRDLSNANRSFDSPNNFSGTVGFRLVKPPS